MNEATRSYDALEVLGRVRLSPNFFMRDFLYSEIAAWHSLRNVPDDAASAIEVGRALCEELLEPPFARKVRIDYQVHGDPLYVLVWQEGTRQGYAVKPGGGAAGDIRVVPVPIGNLLRYEAAGQASARELESYFAP